MNEELRNKKEECYVLFRRKMVGRREGRERQREITTDEKRGRRCRGQEEMKEGRKESKRIKKKGIEGK